ncbi:MAG: hypothetical protein E6G92_07195 [Alphaproteobacteria bacterium]|nr:MAG: hypothetical protein E6G92_07195 [Alphaproteobacteria bacterium]
MIEPTQGERAEMLDLLKRTHAWIDGLMVGGVSENVAVTAMQVALIERLLRAAGVSATVEWLQRQADFTMAGGDQLLAEIKRAGH